MLWFFCEILTIAIFVVYIILWTSSRKKKNVSLLNYMFAATFLSLYVVIFPIVWEMVSDIGVIGVVCVSFVNVMQVFLMECGYDFVTQAIDLMPENIRNTYCVISAVLFLFAPTLTASALLSLLTKFFSSIRYRLHYWNDTYIFSELNNESIILATDIKKKHHRALIVFASVEKNQVPQELMYEARRIDSVLFSASLLRLPIAYHCKNTETYVFLMSPQLKNNLDVSVEFIEMYSNIKNIRLYVFTKGIESELILSSIPKNEIKVKRIDISKSMVYGILCQDGYKLFKEAKQESKSSDKMICVIIVGNSDVSIQMFKTLLWFCQMDGYKLRINLFSNDKCVKEKLDAQCPEMLLKAIDNFYEAKIYEGIDFKSIDFMEQLKKMKEVTFAFVDTDNDTENMDVAMKLRIVFERMGIEPRIQAVRKNVDNNDVIAKAENFRGQPYKINFVGDRKSLYSEINIISSELENEALQSHLQWGLEEEFWAYEYNYNSSMTLALHNRVKRLLGINSKKNSCPNAMLKKIQSVEHRRWCVYMRTEGYIYSGTNDKLSRNDLGKMHNDLVSFDELSSEERDKTTLLC